MNRATDSLLAATLLLSVLALGSCGPAAPHLVGAGSVRIDATRDIWLSAVEGERDWQMGAARRIKLKASQEFGLIDFDVSNLRGQTIERAFLYLKPDGGHRLGLNGGTDLRWLTVSTVSSDWREGASNKPGPNMDADGATFLRSSQSGERWGFEGANALDMTLGNGNSIRFDGQLEPIPGDKARVGWLRIEIPPSLVEALVAGASYGLAVFDGSTDPGTNCYVKSRESGEGPYVVVETKGSDWVAPAPPDRVVARPAPLWATTDSGALEVGLAAAPDAFSYDVRVNGQNIERWQIPFADPADPELTFPIKDLPADRELEVEIAAVDAAGNRSSFVSIRGNSSSVLTVPRLPEASLLPGSADPPEVSGARVWAFPEVTKVDPVTARVLSEPRGPELRRGNPVWDAGTMTIRLAAARGEIVSFQIAVEGLATGCRLAVSDLIGSGRSAGGRIPRDGVKLWRNWYVERHSEYALPLQGTFSVPAADNGIADQILQAITVDLHVPIGTPPGDYSGTLTVTTDQGSVALSLQTRVYNVVLPEVVHFNVELNAYQGPGRAGSSEFIESFRLAHYHRATINRVPYSQKGDVHEDWAPKLDRNGSITDWSAFDEGLGGLLDGSWFAGNPRKGIPVATLYLPLFEGWPLDFRSHYQPGPGVPVSPKDQDLKRRHDLLAKPIAEALDQRFKDAFRAAVSEFVAHFQEREWNRTMFQVYLNNKPRWGYSMWSLDEPVEFLDWAALNFFARLTKAGVHDPAVYTAQWHEELSREGLAGMKRNRPTILFRADISRPMWQGSASDGLINALYVGRRGFEAPRPLRQAKTRMPTRLYTYGSPNPVGSNNWQSVAWCLDAFVHEFDGVLPWQSLDGVEALTVPTTNALLIDAGRFGQAVASLRLHALRRGAQDVELLRLLQLQRSWSREQIGLLIQQSVSLEQADLKHAALAEEDNAAARTYESLHARDFYVLKAGILELLEEGAGSW